jgi:flagella basal body P-ring formation protein FlgA
MPILELPKERYEAKHRLKKFTILTKRDVTALFLVRRGTYVTVTLQDEGVNIVFSARAIQNGRYGDTIAVIHNNKKKIYVTVTGKNRVKVK